VLFFLNKFLIFCLIKKNDLEFSYVLTNIFSSPITRQYLYKKTLLRFQKIGLSVERWWRGMLYLDRCRLIIKNILAAKNILWISQETQRICSLNESHREYKKKGDESQQLSKMIRKRTCELLFLGKWLLVHMRKFYVRSMYKIATDRSRMLARGCQIKYLIITIGSAILPCATSRRYPSR